MRKEVLLKVVFYSFVITVVFIFTFPFVYMILSSFKLEGELTSPSPTFIPSEFSLSNFEVLLKTTPIFLYLRNSIITSSLVVTLTVVISVQLAYILTRFKIRGSLFMSKTTIFFYAFPDTILGLSYYILFSKLGLLDTHIALAIGQFAIVMPFSLWILWAYFRQIPIELDEAALVDGASRFQVLWKIIFPLALPGIGATAAFSFVTSWNEYTLASMLTVSEGMKTLPVRIGLLATSEGAFWGLNMSMCTIAIVPAFIFLFFMLKPMIRGLTAGALKG